MTQPVLLTLLLIALTGLACGAKTPESIRDSNEAARSGATAEPGSRTTFVTDFGPISPSDLRTGDCSNSSVNPTEPFEVLLAPCDGSWEFQVVDHVLIGEDIEEWPGDDYFIQESEAQCSLTTVFVFYPSEDSWFLGDRSLYCMRGP